MATKYAPIKDTITVTSDDPVAIAGIVAALEAMGAKPMTLDEWTEYRSAGLSR